MEVCFSDKGSVAEACDCLVVGITAEGQLSAAGKTLQQSGLPLAEAFTAGDLSGKLGDVRLIPTCIQGGPQAVLVVGMGAADKQNAETAFRVGATALRQLGDRQRQRVVVSLADMLPTAAAESLVVGAISGTAGQALYQREPALHPPTQLAFTGIDDAALQAARVVGESLNWTRRLVNEPPNRLYPESFAEHAEQLAAECGLEAEVWETERLQQERCRAILAVGGGSDRPPRLVMLRYRGGPAAQQPIVLVGKGVTFDSGGLSIKPSDAMVDMKCDMAGAATVLGVIRAAALLKLPCNVVALCGLAENMLSGTSYKLGDVIETRSGKTIEILNTDAEGRVVLADVLDVALQQQPAAIVDLATLTGACMVALGADVAGLMGNDPQLSQQISDAAQRQGEWVWPLPMFELFDEQVRSKVADIKNVGEGRWGGAITAAKFLQQFVGQARWLHIDIAGPAYATAPKPYRDAGGTGAMVRTLIDWLRSGPQL